VRDTGVEPVSSVWKTDILADIRIPPVAIHNRCNCIKLEGF
jgi:hypothetical protein